LTKAKPVAIEEKKSLLPQSIDEDDFTDVEPVGNKHSRRHSKFDDD
jgi:hypothetical protein